MHHLGTRGRRTLLGRSTLDRYRTVTIIANEQSGFRNLQWLPHQQVRYQREVQARTLVAVFMGTPSSCFNIVGTLSERSLGLYSHQRGT